jgi:hypothetical protein
MRPFRIINNSVFLLFILTGAAPQDGFRFTARFYGPYTPLIDGSYDMPGIVRVD